MDFGCWVRLFHLFGLNQENITLLYSQFSFSQLIRPKDLHQDLFEISLDHMVVYHLSVMQSISGEQVDRTLGFFSSTGLNPLKVGSV